jgi:hypothetical protein
MNQPNAFVKAAVIASSLLLAGAFVLYRAGVFSGDGELDRSQDLVTAGGETAAGVNAQSMPDTPGVASPKGTGKTPSDTAKKSTVKVRIEKDTAEKEPVFIGGSKSGVDLIRLRNGEADSSEPAVDTAPRRERFMGGSKSLAPIIEPSESEPDPKPVKAPQGSKEPKQNR